MIYEVSDQGRVKSYRRYPEGRLLRPGCMSGGHVSVSLGRKNSLCVHALVLLAFVGPPPEKHECRHLNGNPSDNRLENLRWGTRSENIGRNTLELGQPPNEQQDKLKDVQLDDAT
jgi:hypothetical protein